MKFCIVFFIFFIQNLIPGQAFPKEDSIKIIREIESRKWIKERAYYRKRECSNDSLRAVNDAKLINKYFISIAAPDGFDFPAQKELETALKKLRIVWGGTWMGNCIGAYTPNSCYYTNMNKFTEEKYGENVINNVIRQTLLDYIDKNPSVIFEYNDHLDWLYEDNEVIANDMINKLFYKKFAYPKGYKKSSNQRHSFTKVFLIFDDESQRLKLDHFEHQMDDYNRVKYLYYFEGKIKDFINSSIFVLSKDAGRYNGVKTSFIIYYK
ncbi:hypothetical protein [Chryseobacterium hagamense]|uniref:Uncharacterized protein n=1 Tax=Chryseobacterium hagamense TaxID=395935 RepID=A0A511YIR0_9FLAO|nr:hypothetical protein [Chryseobacterium hagamense]GEN75085.1 hypothetical protein CHA01nite_08250 [Chryseobacterium hagamense]